MFYRSFYTTEEQIHELFAKYSTQLALSRCTADMRQVWGDQETGDGAGSISQDTLRLLFR
jgi:hypothetical protein